MNLNNFKKLLNPINSYYNHNNYDANSKTSLDSTSITYRIISNVPCLLNELNNDNIQINKTSDFIYEEEKEESGTENSIKLLESSSINEISKTNKIVADKNIFNNEIQINEDIVLIKNEKLAIETNKQIFELYDSVKKNKSLNKLEKDDNEDKLPNLIILNEINELKKSLSNNSICSTLTNSSQITTTSQLNNKNPTEQQNNDQVPEWLKEDTHVIVSTNSVMNKRGFVRFIGKTKFAHGIWIGVELEDLYGKNDGSLKGVRYFTCPENKGVFVKADKLSQVKII